MMNGAVYRLESSVEDGFVFEESETQSMLGNRSIYDDFADYLLHRNGAQVTRLAALWKPRAVRGDRVLPEDDYPMVRFAPAFSQRAVDALRDMLKPNGELLPLITPVGLGQYYIYNITTVADVLDHERSQITFHGNSNSAFKIDHHEFFANRLKGLSIFRLRERSYDAYVTEIFLERVRQNGLSGFHFVKVWPLPPGTNWEQIGTRELESARPRNEFRGPMISSKPPSRITSRPFEEGPERESVFKARENYAKELGADFRHLSTAQVQEWIYQRLAEINGAKMTLAQKEDRAFWLAFAWADSVVQELHWEWAMLEAEGDAKTPVVASPDRSYAIPILQYITRLATVENSDQTSLLLFNMIAAGKLDPAEPGSLKLLS